MFDMDGNRIEVGDTLTEDYQSFWEVKAFNGVMVTLVNMTSNAEISVADCILDCTWQLYK